MEINFALILSAGLGTRMGEIGKHIPKVMWPIFGTPLIDLQIKYCQDLGIKKIFINTHYKSEILEEHLRSKYGDAVTILHEDPLLDSGGAIHNLAAQKEVNYHGNLLMVNGDQFLLFDKNEVLSHVHELSEKRALLFGINVDKGEIYNETKIHDGLLVAIEKANDENSFVTYSGLGLLKLDGLQPVPGISKFFQTVTNYKVEKVGMVVPKKYEYWDFGTAEIYYRNIFKIIDQRKQESMINNFLHHCGVLEDQLDQYASVALKSIRHSLKDQFVEGMIVREDIVQKP